MPVVPFNQNRNVIAGAASQRMPDEPFVLMAAAQINEDRKNANTQTDKPLPKR
jgi:hypothetical protein